MYDPYNYDRGMGGEPEIIEERTSEVSMYQPIGPKTAASVLIRNAILNFRSILRSLRGAVILGKDHVLYLKDWPIFDVGVPRWDRLLSNKMSNLAWPSTLEPSTFFSS